MSRMQRATAWIATMALGLVALLCAAPHEASAQGLGGLVGVLDHVTAPLTEPVTEVAGAVLAGDIGGVIEEVPVLVNDLVAPITEPVLDPVVSIAEPVVQPVAEPVLSIVQPVAEPALEIVSDVAPLAEPVLEAVPNPAPGADQSGEVIGGLVTDILPVETQTKPDAAPAEVPETNVPAPAEGESLIFAVVDVALPEKPAASSDGNVAPNPVTERVIELTPRIVDVPPVTGILDGLSNLDLGGPMGDERSRLPNFSSLPDLPNLVGLPSPEGLVPVPGLVIPEPITAQPLAPVVEIVTPIAGSITEASSPALTPLVPIVEQVVAPVPVALDPLVPALEPVAPILTTVIEPLPPVLDEVAPTLEPPVRALEPILEQVATLPQPVMEAAEPILQPLAPIVESGAAVVAPLAPALVPLGETLAAVVHPLSPVTDVVMPVVEPVVAPVIEALNPIVEPLTPVIDVVAPVVEPVVTPLLPVVEPPAPFVPPIVEPPVPGEEPVREPEAPIVDPLPVPGGVVEEPSITAPAMPGQGQQAGPETSAPRPVERPVIEQAIIVPNAAPATVPVPSLVAHPVTQLPIDLSPALPGFPSLDRVMNKTGIEAESTISRSIGAVQGPSPVAELAAPASSAPVPAQPGSSPFAYLPLLFALAALVSRYRLWDLRLRIPSPISQSIPVPPG